MILRLMANGAQTVMDTESKDFLRLYSYWLSPTGLNFHFRHLSNAAFFSHLT
jgi:hypothetical protein